MYPPPTLPFMVLKKIIEGQKPRETVLLKVNVKF
jgi:hypothetical protein